MEEKEYLHVENDDKMLTLHDCFADRISFEDGILTFYFSDGFWISSNHPDNSFNNTVRTDASEVRFMLLDGDECDARIYVHSLRVRRPMLKYLRSEIRLYDFIRNVNSGKFRLEFLYLYKGYNSYFFECWLWQSKKPYHRECQLTIDASGVCYHWNKLRPECPW